MTTTIGIRSRWKVIFPVVGALLGIVAAFIVGPAVGWLLNQIGDAPGPLRIAALLPLAWAIPVLAILGAVAGVIMLGQWEEEAGGIAVNDDGLTVEKKSGKRLIRSPRAIFTDGHDLVALDAEEREVLRTPIDEELTAQLEAALAEHGHPYLGTVDPHEADFVEWVEGATPVSDEAATLLLERHRAQQDGQPGTVERLRAELNTLGIAVRDREGQEYRQI